MIDTTHWRLSFPAFYVVQLTSPSFGRVGRGSGRGGEPEGEEDVVDEMCGHQRTLDDKRCPPFFSPIRRWSLPLTLALAAILPVAIADEPGIEPEQAAKTVRHTPWTTSRVLGSPEPPPPYTVRRLFPKLKFEEPVHLTQGPSGQRYFLTEYEGRVLSFNIEGETGQTDLLLELEMNIFSVEFHPRFDDHPYLYVFGNTAPNRKEGEVPHNQVLRFDVIMDDPPKAVVESQQVILEYDSNGHNGGEAKFGPDGYLYVSSGDGTSDSDQGNTGQDVTDFPGGMLRIDVDHPDQGLAYGIPDDNPLLDIDEARGELWAYGFRNPWRFSFDTKTGNLYVGDVGQDLWEMIYLVRPGGNYGWSVREGDHDFHPLRKRGPTPIVPPLVEHHHTESRSITGGHVYHGSRLPELDGTYIYGDYETGIIWGLRHQGNKVIWHQELARVPLKVASFAVGANEEFLLIDYQAGELYELIPAPKSKDHPPFPKLLSQTGLFASTEMLTPAAGLVPYSVNSAQWIDGAKAVRFIGLPGESQITFDNSGTWGFSDGAVLTKTVMLPKEPSELRSRRLETQILTRQSGQWQGYSYVWNEQQTDAELAPEGGAMLSLDTPASERLDQSKQRSWRVVSRSECMVCHSRAAGFTLGMRTSQMNHEDINQSETMNQLRHLEQLGVFTKPLPQEPEKLPRLSNPYDQQADVSERARSYLHANCSHCHIGAGGGNAKIVLSSQTKLEETFLVGGRPLHADFGIAGAMLVAPGDPDRSVLYQRVSRRGNGQMPPLASNQVDQRATDLIGQWIEQLEVPESARKDVDRAFAQLQGASGTLSRWYVTDALSQRPDTELISEAATAQPESKPTSGAVFRWRSAIGTGSRCRVSLSPSKSKQPESIWLARADLIIEDDCDIEVTTGTSGSLRLLINGAERASLVNNAQRDDDVERFDAKLTKGRNRLLIEITSAADSRPFFEAGFRRKSSNPQHEQYTVAALSQDGNAEHGRMLFRNTTKTQCLKCHKIENEGGDAGPDLSGIGDRLSPARIIESILRPSQTVAPDYRNVIVELESGRVLAGIVADETPQTVTLTDAQAKQRVISKSEVVVMQPQPTSLMPDGLEKSISQEEFVDLIAFLRQWTSESSSPFTDQESDQE